MTTDSCTNIVVFLVMVLLILIAASKGKKKKVTDDSVISFLPNCAGGGAMLNRKPSFESQPHLAMTGSECRVLPDRRFPDATDGE